MTGSAAPAASSEARSPAGNDRHAGEGGCRQGQVHALRGERHGKEKPLTGDDGARDGYVHCVAVGGVQLERVALPSARRYDHVEELVWPALAESVPLATYH